MSARVGDLLPALLEDARAQGVQRRGGNRTPGPRKGRPTRLHPELQTRICESIRAGNYQETAAVAAGINRATYFGWRARGLEARALVEALGRLPDDKTGEQVFLDFLDATDAARAEAEANAVQALTRLALGGEVVEVEIHEDDDGCETGRTIRFSQPNPRSIEFFLERGYQDHWGKKIEVAGPDQGPIPIEVEVSARDALRRHLGQTAERIIDVDEVTP